MTLVVSLRETGPMHTGRVPMHVHATVHAAQRGRRLSERAPGSREPAASAQGAGSSTPSTGAERSAADDTAGARAERLVYERLRAVLADSVAVLANVEWLLRERGGDRRGEADIVIGDPERGILVIEVKAGRIRRDSAGRWWAGGRELPRSPFQQAADSRYALVKKLAELPDWPARLVPVAGEAVALPDVELESMKGSLGLLGLDVDPALIADQSTFVDDEGGRRELTAFVDGAFEAWSGGAGTRAPGRDAIDLLVATLTEPFEILPMLRNELAAGEREVVRLTKGQFGTLNLLRGVRRASIVGGAGTGKTMLAAEKARRLAKEGFRTLLVCFNAPLSTMLAEEMAPTARDTGLDRRQDVSPAVRGPRRRGRRPRRPARAHPAGLVGRDAASRARRGRRCARAPIPRDRRRRRPGLRRRLAALARESVVRRSRRRVLRVPRPRAGHLPRRPCRRSRDDRIPTRRELPERAADP